MRIEGQHIAAADGTKAVSEFLGRLEEGDVIRAKVLQISPDEAVLRLSDGSVIKAQLAEKLNAKEGQTIMLTVANKDNGTLVLETVKDSGKSDIFKGDLVKAMVENLKLPADSRNISLMSEFLKQNISPDAEQMKNALALLSASREIDAAKAVFLASKGVSPGSENIETVAKLIGGEIKLGEIIKDIESAIDGLRRNLYRKNAAADIHKEQDIIRIIAASVNKAFVDAAAKEAPLKSDMFQAGANIHQTNESSESSSLAASERGSLTALESIPETVNEKSQAAQSQRSLTIGSGSSTESTESNVSVTNGAGITENISLDSSAINSASDTESISSTARNTASDAVLNSAGNAERGSDKTAEIKNNEAESSRKIPDRAVIGKPDKPSTDDILNKVALDAKGTENKKDFTTQDPFIRLKESIDDIFIKIAAGEIPFKSDIESIEAEINNKLNLLRTVASLPEITRSDEGREVFEAVSRLNDAVRAMNYLIDNNIAYYQLPVNLQGYNTNVEIYIMKNTKKKKKIDPQDAVVFISLDTKNIGRVESLIVLKGKNVSIKFRTERQQVIDLGKEKIKALYEGLESIGYKLASIKYELMEDPTPPVGIEKLISKFLTESQNKVDLRL